MPELCMLDILFFKAWEEGGVGGVGGRDPYGKLAGEGAWPERDDGLGLELGDDISARSL